LPAEAYARDSPRERVWRAEPKLTREIRSMSEAWRRERDSLLAASRQSTSLRTSLTDRIDETR